MKKIILIVALMISIHMETKAQQGKKFTASAENHTFSMYSSVNNFPDKDANFYLHRSKNQRIIGWVTLGGGLVLSGIGLLAAVNSKGTTVDQYGNYSEDDNTTIAAVLLTAGGLSGIASIPFMIMASGNKHKARLMLKNEATGFGTPPQINKNIPGISMIVALGK